jgi:hypothetical protein
MARYARIVNDAVAELRNFGVAPNPNPAKGLDWRSCPVVSPPAVDPLSEVLEAPAYQVGASEVTESWSVRAKTAQEIDDDKTAALATFNGTLYSPLLKIVVNLHNRIRVLEGLSTHTEAQVKTAIKNLL